MATLGNTPRPAYVYDTETDTWVPVGVGAHTHDYIPNTLVDAKGDILTATADNVPARLAKGADGTVLVSDSTTQTGLAWQPYAAPFVAGKNKIINGDFSIWQRGTSWAQSTFQSEPYTADRFCFYSDTTNGTRTISRQTFTPGSAPVAGYEGKYFWRYQESVAGSATENSLKQRIEDVQTFAGQTVTVSYWAKADASRNITVNVNQQFGSGGSARVDTVIATQTLTTSWVRYTHTVNIPSISGKTVGTNSSLQFNWYFSTNTTQTIDIWGVQVEAGSIATPFTTHTGSIQGELAACQRYYWRQTTKSSNYSVVGNGFGASTANVRFQVKNPVQMRTEPSSIDFNGLYAYDGTNLIGSLSSVTLEYANESYLNFVTATAGGSFVANRPYSLLLTYPSAWIGASAEL